MIQKYTKKPVTIEAIQFKEDTIPTIKEWLGENLVLEPHLSSVHWAYYIVTLEGKMLVSQGDFIIKGVKGEFYPCKPDIFYATYNGPVKVLWDHTTGEYNSEYFKPNIVTIKEKEVEKISEDEIEQAKAMEQEQMKNMYLKGIENYDPTFKRKSQWTEVDNMTRRLK